MLIGQQAALAEQLGLHQADFSESRRLMLLIASGIVCFGSPLYYLPFVAG